MSGSQIMRPIRERKLFANASDIAFQTNPHFLLLRGRDYNPGRDSNCSWPQLNPFDSNEASLARRGAYQEPIRRLPLHFNVADEVSCRGRAIKCVRCRASFAPIRASLRLGGIWLPR